MSAPPGYPQEFFHHSQPYGAQQQAHAGNQQPGIGYSQQLNQQLNPPNQYSSHQQGSSYGGQPGHHQPAHSVQQQQGSYQSTSNTQHGMPGGSVNSSSTSTASGITKKLFSEGKKLVSQYRSGLKPPVNGQAGPAPLHQGVNHQQHAQNPPHGMHFQQQPQQQQYSQQQGGYFQQQQGNSGYSHPQGHNW